MKNAAVDYKNCSVFRHDYSNFSEHLFLDDFKKLPWEDIVDNQNSNINVKFDRFYEKVYSTVIHHAPQKLIKLFLIYINDLPNVSKYLRFYLFADVTNIYFEAKNLGTLQKIMDRELRHVKKWLEANKLALNIEKTNSVVFHSPAKNSLNP